jgi:hypothetical protein
MTIQITNFQNIMTEDIHDNCKREHSKEILDQNKTKKPAGQIPNSESLCMMSKHFSDLQVLSALLKVKHWGLGGDWFYSLSVAFLSKYLRALKLSTFWVSKAIQVSPSQVLCSGNPAMWLGSRHLLVMEEKLLSSFPDSKSRTTIWPELPKFCCLLGLEHF